MKKEIVKNFISTKRIATDDFSEQYTSNYKAFDFSSSYYGGNIGYTIPVKKQLEAKIENLQFEVENQKWNIPSELRHIHAELLYSKHILTLEKNWDDCDGEKISSDTYILAIKFLVEYSIYLLKEGVIIDTPEINPCSDGSIDLSWRTKNARLLINIKRLDNQHVAKFFGDLYSPMTSKSGYITMDNLDLSLIEWMKNLQK